MAEAGEIEYEFGVAIPGVIKPPAEWAHTAIKHLQPGVKLDWQAIFGRSAPVVLELGCGNGRYTPCSALVKQKKPYDRWFWLSAIALGVTAASKFSYAPVIVVIPPAFSSAVTSDLAENVVRAVRATVRPAPI